MKRTSTLAAITALMVLLALSCLWCVGAAAEEQEQKCDIILDKSTVQVGQPITATWTITGGKEFRWDQGIWYINELNAGETFGVATAYSGDAFIPKFGASGFLRVTIEDIDGVYRWWDSSTFLITGSSEANPLEVLITLDKSTISAGQTINATWAIIGGKAPYEVYGEWRIIEANNPEQRETALVIDNSSALSPKFGISGYFKLHVTDADGRGRWHQSSSFSITDSDIVDPPEVFITLDKTTVAVGQQIKASWIITGGTAPYELRTSRWYIDEGGAQPRVPVLNSSSAFVPLFGLSGNLYLRIIDAKGREVVASSSSFQITGSKSLSEVVSYITWECEASASGSYARAKWLHDYLINHAEYDHNLEYISPYALLLIGKGICWSYSGTYQLLLNEVGISCKFIESDEMNHRWNLVNINGNWFHVDVTNDDESKPVYTRFLKSDQFMKELGYVWDASKYPACPLSWGETLEVDALPGDANGDNAIDIMDLVTIIDYIVSDTSPTSITNADANGDGTVDIMDLVWIIDRIVSN